MTTQFFYPSRTYSLSYQHQGKGKRGVGKRENIMCGKGKTRAAAIHKIKKTTDDELSFAFISVHHLLVVLFLILWDLLHALSLRSK